MDKLFNRITIKQEVVTYTLVVPMLIYFLALFLPYITNPIVLITIAGSAVSVLIIGNISKQKKIKIYEDYLISDSSDQSEKNKALKIITGIPRIDAISVFLRWMAAGVSVAFSGYYYAGATLEEVTIELVFVGATIIISMPIFYLISEKEISSSIISNNERFTDGDKEYLLGISIRAKLLWTICSIVFYIMIILISLIILTSRGIFDVTLHQVGLIAFITDTLIIALVTALLFVNNLRQRLNYIKDYILNISQGRLRSISIDSNDEFGLLLYELNKMGNNLKQKQKIVEDIADGDGDFSVQVELASDDDQFGKSLQKMLQSLNQVLTQVDETIKQVNSGSDQISIASQNLSDGAIKQASAVEETSSAINELSKEMLDNANQAGKASELVDHSADNARKGKSFMENLISVMERNNKSTKKIQEINKLIDNIAFQIKLLALNANVEAARAGKAGRGFAVVADEVKNLALRSSDAVNETSEVINSTVKNIKEMNNLVNETSDQLDVIFTNTEEASTLVKEIASNSLDEANNLENLMDALNQISEVSQSNSASSEETASSVDELASQANQLNKQISKFKLIRN